MHRYDSGRYFFPDLHSTQGSTRRSQFDVELSVFVSAKDEYKFLKRLVSFIDGAGELIRERENNIMKAM